jgi:hypothetical protein
VWPTRSAQFTHLAADTQRRLGQILVPP